MTNLLHAVYCNALAYFNSLSLVAPLCFPFTLIYVHSFVLSQDGVASPDDVDAAISQGLGLRYSFMGPFETMHLNADGIKDYCMKYGANIHAVCDSQCSSRPLSGSTLDVVKEAMEKKIPVEQLTARRKWRDSRLAALAVHQKDTT